MTKELRRLRRVRARLEKEEDSPSEADLDTALLVLWHSMGDMQLGQQYLQQCRARQKKRSCPEGHVSLSPQAPSRRQLTPQCPQSWYRALEARWKSWSVDDEVRALVPLGARETRSRRAKSFVEGARLETYLRSQNQKGIAPRGPALLRVHQAAVEPLADAAREEAPGERRKRRRRQNDWVRRWAKRRGVLRGRFKAGAGLSLEEVRAKAFSVIKPAQGSQTSAAWEKLFFSQQPRTKNASGAPVRGTVFEPK